MLDGLSNPHTKLAMSCAIHLKSHFEGLRALHGREGVRDIELVQYRRAHPFLAYAEYNLAYHAGMSKHERTLDPFVQTVLSQQASNTFYPFSPHRFNTTLNQSLHGGKPYASNTNTYTPLQLTLQKRLSSESQHELFERRTDPWSKEAQFST